MTLVVEEHVAVVGLGQRGEPDGSAHRVVGVGSWRRVGAASSSNGGVSPGACAPAPAGRLRTSVEPTLGLQMPATSSVESASAAIVVDAVGFQLGRSGGADAGDETGAHRRHATAARTPAANSQNWQWSHGTGTVSALGAGSISSLPAGRAGDASTPAHRATRTVSNRPEPSQMCTCSGSTPVGRLDRLGVEAQLQHVPRLGRLAGELRVDRLVGERPTRRPASSTRAQEVGDAAHAVVHERHLEHHVVTLAPARRPPGRPTAANDSPFDTLGHLERLDSPSAR